MYLKYLIVTLAIAVIFHLPKTAEDQAVASLIKFLVRKCSNGVATTENLADVVTVRATQESTFMNRKTLYQDGVRC